MDLEMFDEGSSFLNAPDQMKFTGRSYSMLITDPHTSNYDEILDRVKYC